MNFRLLKAGVLGVALFVFTTTALAQKVAYREKDKIIEANGTIDESDPLKVIKVKPNIGTTVKEVKPNTVVDVQYEAKTEVKKAWDGAWRSEWVAAATAKDAKGRREALLAALKAYQELVDKAGGDPKVQRQMQYKVAILTANLAEGDKTQNKLAIDLLEKHQKASSNSWQIFSVVDALSRLYVETNEFEKAAGAFDSMSKLPGVDETTKNDCQLKAADYLMKGKKFPEAADRLNKIVGTLKPTDPSYEAMKMKLILCKANTPEKFKEAITELKKMKDAAKDENKLAMLYNTLGDCYMMGNQPNDAKYEYLYVDLVYNKDRSQHLRALEQLVQVFKDLKQLDKSKDYMQKLEKLRTQ
jgi:tetratricopeptide (TPR) repeat protein